MAKCRIGHFVEAEILEALEVDYIDESEVLTPADEEHHVDKWKFKVPFVCGCRNLGEALRRINEGAAMIRTKGEAGTGDIVNAVRHMRAVVGEIRRLGSLPEEELFTSAKDFAGPFELVKWVSEHGRLPVVMFTAGGIATPADAALCMQLGADGVFVGSGIFKSEEPSVRAKAIVEATTHFRDPEILARVSTGLGEPMRGLETAADAGPRSCSRRAAGGASRTSSRTTGTSSSPSPATPGSGCGLPGRLGGELLGASVYEIPPGEATWPYHLHYGNEELLLVLEGSPTLRTPDGEHELSPGDSALFPRGQEGAHQVLNRSDRACRVVVVSTMVAPEIGEYPDSGKLGLFAGAAPGGLAEERAVEVLPARRNGSTTSRACRSPGWA